MLILSVAAVYSADKDRGAAIDGHLADIGRGIASIFTNAIFSTGIRPGGAMNLATSLPAASNAAISNLQFSSISVSPTNVALGMVWAFQTGTNDTLDVYSKTNLTEVAWSHLAEVDVSLPDEAALAAIPLEWLGSPSSAFFRVGTRLDADGDGLPDAFELLASLTNPAEPDTDGQIDAGEQARAKQGSAFRFWINDDDDSGELTDTADDIPGSGPNAADGFVNGYADVVEFASRTNSPANMPDEETSSRHLVFLHGVNVTQANARGWAAEIFKRMWQAGMTAKFTGVTWRSDIGTDMNYQENVSNAFFTASVLADQIATLPGDKVLMAHSLGNMVCSSMIQDYGLVPACYLMCNSAVPAEAYDTDQTLRVPQLVHPEWEEYPTNSWASSWHWLFRNEPNDDRRFLGWPGRFSNVTQYAVNFYSTGDEVLELATNNKVHSWTGISDSWGHYSWHKQELFKGRGGFGGTNWSGWNIDENIFGVNKISAAEAQAMTEADFKTNTVFYCYPPSMNQPTIPLLVRSAHLAQGIPALTPAAGRVKFQGWDAMTNFDLNSTDANQGMPRPNNWPNRSNYQGRWCHSDLKYVAYFYVFKFYDKAVEKGSLK